MAARAATPGSCGAREGKAAAQASCPSFGDGFGALLWGQSLWELEARFAARVYANSYDWLKTVEAALDLARHL